ncbi:integrase [Elizabethkingia anophelis]|nr:integrase [Elizabethkingia anophelis]MDV3860900.1 integrase [Elizabethkingia anophelis]MDV3909348.1 integrase [Elizabethkingia anophelis]MDV3922806.1 integrase [Elizabethkingia anophelis]MDV3989103.1 integrase [Elizabethkingia anophelis]
MATFRFEVNNKSTKNKTYNILLCITTEGKRKRLKTSIELKKKSDFNTKAKQDNWIRSSEPYYKVWNEVLSKELEKAKQTYRDLKDTGLATSEKIASEMLAGEKTNSFLKYAKQRTQEMHNAGSIRNWKKYNGFLNKLENYLTNEDGGVKDLTFAEITPAFLSKFEAYLHTLKNEREPEKKLHPNTIEVILNIFKTLIKRAVEIERFMKFEQNPFLIFSYRGVKTQKEKLNEDEIELIINLELEGNSLLWHCRNYFLFSFFCAGIRVGDLIQLRWVNITSDGRLYYQMGKNRKPRDLILVEQAKEIISFYFKEGINSNDYIFPLLNSQESYANAVTQEQKDTMPTELKIKLLNQISAKNALINKYLKKIADLAGLQKKLSFHISRHSFAKIAKQKGIDNSNVQSLLAHSSIKITENYMGDFDTSENDRALQTIFNKPQQNPRDELIALLKKMDDNQIVELLNKIKD